ncbi:Unknown protein, partial [Striga hermonthica]
PWSMNHLFSITFFMGMGFSVLCVWTLGWHKNKMIIIIFKGQNCFSFFLRETSHRRTQRTTKYCNRKTIFLLFSYLHLTNFNATFFSCWFGYNCVVHYFTLLNSKKQQNNIKTKK